MIARRRCSRAAAAAGLLLTIAAPPRAAAAREADPAELPGVLLSRQLLEARGLAPGDVVRLSADRGGAGARAFRIVSGYEPIPDPFRLAAARHEARLHLPDLIALDGARGGPLERESAGWINVALVDPEESAAVAAEIAASLPGIVAYPAAGDDQAARVFVVLERFHAAVAVVTLLGSTAFLLALMVIRSDERRGATGILRLVGLSRRRVLAGVLVEGTLIAVAGAALGLLFATASQGLFNRFFQWYYDTPLVFCRVTPAIALRCVALAVPLGVVAGVGACWTMLRADIMALLRR
jgi:putative ABC transport system permease protein